MNTKFNLILLAAGESKRMGYPKALLEFDNTHNFLEQILSEYLKHKQLNNIILVLNTELLEISKQQNIKLQKKIKITFNKNLEKDRFFSIFLAAKKMHIPYPSFIQNIDNPFIKLEDIDTMIQNLNEKEILIPKINTENVHPILVNSIIINQIKNSPNFEGNLRTFLLHHKKQYIDLQNEMLLLNINTPENYETIFRQKPKIKQTN